VKNTSCFPYLRVLIIDTAYAEAIQNKPFLNRLFVVIKCPILKCITPIESFGC
jgi:hypothetical protein